MLAFKVKCSCGKVLASKYTFFDKQVFQRKNSSSSSSSGGGETTSKVTKVQYLTTKNTEKSVEGKVLDEMKISKYCCRREMLTKVKMDEVFF